ncbi:MAG: small ribosomal subunit Rsm22 family protein [Treponema sp.]|jgi:hypothetical protein|nr:small ribosomal subunit Rsm22 family protein [Treponema sp.]
MFPGLFPPLSNEVRQDLEKLLSLIDEVFPVPGRFRSRLPQDVAECSRLLSGGRSERDGGYLGRPRLLSAYLHYFLPWNVFRLCRLFGGMEGSLETYADLSDGDAVSDLGSGPLTLPLAMAIALRKLRPVKLEFRCVDRTGAVLEAGKKLFDTFTGGMEKNWTVKTIRGPLEAEIYGKRARLVTAVNVFNENGNYGGQKVRALLSSRCAEDGSILVVEPGIPQGGAFISGLRRALQQSGRAPVLPCTHSAPCAMDRHSPYGPRRGHGEKWCHFSFDTLDAPGALRRLSAAAGIPKQRASLSFLLAGPVSQAAVPAADINRLGENAPRSAVMDVRIISDMFPLPAEPRGPKPGTWGRYGCSEEGLVLAVGSRNRMDAAPPGALVRVSRQIGGAEKRDRKSGALRVEVPDDAAPAIH